MDFAEVTAPMNGISIECVGMAANVGWADGTIRLGQIMAVDPIEPDHQLAETFTAFVTVRFPVPPKPDPRYRAWLN